MSGTLSGVYQVDIQKIYNGVETWTNVYHVTAPDQTQAMAHGVEIANIEKTIHSNDITINAIRVRPFPTAPGAVGFTNTVNIVGTASNTSPVPLECCVRVTMSNGTTRPSSKYLRGCIGVGDFSGRQNVGASLKTAINTNYCVPLAAKTYLVDVHGGLMPTMIVQTKVANHQLRRGSKRKAVPVIA